MSSSSSTGNLSSLPSTPATKPKDQHSSQKSSVLSSLRPSFKLSRSKSGSSGNLLKFAVGGGGVVANGGSGENASESGQVFRIEQD